MAYDIGEAFQKIEEEMIASMSRNLKRHIETEEKEGLNYSMWQAEQLTALNNFRKDNKKIFSGYFSTINSQIGDILQKTNGEARLTQEKAILEAIRDGYKIYNYDEAKSVRGQFFKINDRKMKALISATQKDMAKAETAMLRMANDEYRKVIFNSEVFYNSGAGTLSQCVDMATKDFLSRGISCIEYSNGARVGIDVYSRMALRTAQTRAYLAGEASKRDEWGVNTVIVNRRGVACPKCLKWVAKVYYDDVWGSLPVTDDKYLRLSEAIKGGLYHPNCKDIHTTYFEDISSDPKPMTQKEIDEANRVYALEQRQRYNERQIRKYKRLMMGSTDPENIAKYSERLSRWQTEQKNFISANSDVLKRRSELEKIFPAPPSLQTVNANAPELDIIKEDPCENGHTWIEEIIDPPSCVDKGVKIKKCSVCGKEMEEEEIPPTGHKWIEAAVIKPATCEEQGEKLFRCEYCRKEKTEYTPALGHSYGPAQVIDPTCTEEGYTFKKCSVCGYIEKTDIKPALGHDFGDWIITREPTVAEYGRKQKVCSRCGEKKYTTIPKLKISSTSLEAKEQQIILDKAKIKQRMDQLSQTKYSGILPDTVTPADYEAKKADISAARTKIRDKLDLTKDDAIDALFAKHNGDISDISYDLEKKMGLDDKQKYGLRYSQLRSASDPKAYMKAQLKQYRADQQATLLSLDDLEDAGKEYLDYSKRIKALDNQLEDVRKELMKAKGIDPDALRAEITDLAEQLQKAGGKDDKLERLLSAKLDDFEKIRARYELPEIKVSGKRPPRTKSAAILDDLQAHADLTKRKFNVQLERHARELGVSKDEARKQLSDAISDITENCDIGMRIRVENLEKVLQDTDGGFKNLFETKTGGGCTNLRARGNGEMQVFGFKKSVPNAGADTGDRPIYGMMIPKLGKQATHDHIEYITRGPGAWYGDGVTCVINKDKVYNNASFTLGDSLDYDTDLCGSTLNKPTFNGSFYGLDTDTLLDKTASPNDRLINTFSDSDEYLEIQIHGKENHSADIIEKVYFTQSAADRAKRSGLLSTLDAKKIPYEILT